MWWRQDHSDYFIPSMLNITPLPLLSLQGDEGPPRILWGYRGDLDSFRKEAQTLLRMPDGEREAAVLHSAIRWHLLEPWDSGRNEFDRASLNKLDARARTSDVDSIIAALDEFARQGGNSAGSAVMTTLYGGGAGTLRALSRIENRSGGWRVASVIRSIRLRMGLEPPEEYDPIALPPAPSKADRDNLRVLLQTSPDSAQDPNGSLAYGKRRKAFETLTIFDPEFVSHFLMNWHDTGGALSGHNEGYGLGSFLAWRCTGDRTGHLRRLTKAEDPYVRVAGAIYFSFENEAEGIKTLQKLSHLSGDPGAWAALNLARRGDRQALARALDVFKSPNDPGIGSQVHRNLQKRLLVLLSNSAARGGLQQPDAWTYEERPDDQLRVYQKLIAWWNENEMKLTLWDPWFEELKEKKIE